MPIEVQKHSDPAGAADSHHECPAQTPDEGAQSGCSAPPSTVLSRAMADKSHARTPMNARIAASPRPQPLRRKTTAVGAGMQELFPRLRTSRMAEQRVVVASAQPIAPGTYVDTPAGRKITGGVHPAKARSRCRAAWGR